MGCTERRHSCRGSGASTITCLWMLIKQKSWLLTSGGLRLDTFHSTLTTSYTHHRKLLLDCQHSFPDKRAQQLPKPILTTFYKGTIEHILSSCITAWYGNLWPEDCADCWAYPPELAIRPAGHLYFSLHATDCLPPTVCSIRSTAARRCNKLRPTPEYNTIPRWTVSTAHPSAPHTMNWLHSAPDDQTDSTAPLL